jgi:hypothetical protein
MSLKVETIGGHLMVHHYVEDVREMHHVRLLSASDCDRPTTDQIRGGMGA